MFKIETVTLKRMNNFAHTNKYMPSTDVFLVTPPFTQLNTPYPATAYLKGFLNTKNVTSFQTDLGIEVTIALFSQKGLQQLSRVQKGELKTYLKKLIERI